MKKQMNTMPSVRRPAPIHRAIQIPPPPARKLTPAETGALMKRARKMGRKGILTPYDHRLLDALLYQCGAPFSGAVVVSYTALSRITGMSRATVAKGLKKLGNNGLLQRVKRRLRLAWHQGGTASLQAPNAYLFNVRSPTNTEYAAQPVNQMLELNVIYQNLRPDVETAREALQKVREGTERANRNAHQAKIELAHRQGRFVAV